MRQTLVSAISAGDARHTGHNLRRVLRPTRQERFPLIEKPCAND